MWEGSCPEVESHESAISNLPSLLPSRNEGGITKASEALA
jgi:hypothetical protein